jgi:hypothetical protein
VSGLDPFTVPAVTHNLAKAPVRARVVVEGTVGSVRTVGWAGGPVTEVALVDDTDLITLAFFGDRGVGGVRPGSRLVAAGAVVNHHDRRVIMSPQLWLLPTPAPSRLVPHQVAHESLVPALAAAHSL